MTPKDPDPGRRVHRRDAKDAEGGEFVVDGSWFMVDGKWRLRRRPMTMKHQP